MRKSPWLRPSWARKATTGFCREGPAASAAFSFEARDDAGAWDDGEGSHVAGLYDLVPAADGHRPCGGRHAFGVVIYPGFLDEPLYAPAARFATHLLCVHSRRAGLHAAFVTTLVLAGTSWWVAHHLPAKGRHQTAAGADRAVADRDGVRLRGRRGRSVSLLAVKRLIGGALGALWRPAIVIAGLPARTSICFDGQPAQARWSSKSRPRLSFAVAGC
jgi:hypothetical protein